MVVVARGRNACRLLPVGSGSRNGPVIVTCTQRPAPACEASDFPVLAATQDPGAPAVPTNLNGITLFPHQRVGATFLYDNPRVFLADVPGLGKTAQVWALIDMLAPLPTTHQGRVLYVTSATLQESVLDDCRKFLPDTSSAIIDGNALASTGTRPPSQVEITSYSKLAKYEHGFAQKRPAVLILDEAAEAKRSPSRRKAILSLTSTANRVIVMTASPYEIDLTNLQGVLSLLGIAHYPGDLTQHGTWRPAYQTPEGFTVPARQTGIRHGHMPALQEKVGRYMLRRTPTAVGINLPTVVHRHHDCQLLPAQKHAYERAGRIPQASSRQAALTRACNIIDGQSAKADELMRQLQSNNERTVVRCESLDLLAEVERRLATAGISHVSIKGDVPLKTRHAIVERYRQDEDLRVLLGSTVIQRGWNLQFVCRCISLTTSWNPEANLQFVGRLARIGSPFTTVEHLVIASATEHERRRTITADRRSEESRRILGGHA